MKNERYSPYEPVPVATNVPADTVQYLQTHQSDYPGVTVQTVTQRSYPQGGTTATHVLGYLGDITQAQINANPKADYNQGSLVGQSGIEAQYEQYLRGVSGSQALSVNASGDVVGTLSRTAPQIGDTVVLNIDTGLQEAGADRSGEPDRCGPQDARRRGRQQAPARHQRRGDRDEPAERAGAGAWPRIPTYDLNQWVGGISTANYAALAASGAENNNAIQGEYTPGSTFKLITATADLQDGVYSPAKYYDDTGTFKVQNCTGGTCNFTDNVGRQRAGSTTSPWRSTVSSDSYFYNLGELFWEGRATYGDNAIQNVAAQYGEGVSTGIDLPNEVGGPRRQPDRTGETPQGESDRLPEHLVVHGRQRRDGVRAGGDGADADRTGGGLCHLRQRWDPLRPRSGLGDRRSDHREGGDPIRAEGARTRQSSSDRVRRRSCRASRASSPIPSRGPPTGSSRVFRPTGTWPARPGRPPTPAPRSQTAGSWPSGPTRTRSTSCWRSSTRVGTALKRRRRWCAVSSTTSWRTRSAP